MRPILLFDVNETLLDLGALDGLFEERMGNASLRPLWFAQMLQLAFVGGLTGSYVNFTDAEGAALEMIAERAKVDLAPSDRSAIVDAMSELPPHPEVVEALGLLQGEGFRMATLTNSVAAVAQAQVRNAGIDRFFEKVLSADSVAQLKPAPAPYRMAAESFGVPIGETCLIAAHAWDVAGALAVGCSAAFVSRPGAVLSPLGPQPGMVARDIAAVAALLLAAERIAPPATS